MNAETRSDHQASAVPWAPGRRRYLVLLVILLLAAGIRLGDLPSKWLWYDELQSVTHSSLPVGELLRSVRAFDPHPPLYYLQLHFWMLVGTSDWWIKSNSVLWSLLALVMLFVVCGEVLGRDEALVASLLFALAPFAVFYAQEARMYALLMFLGLASFGFVRRFVERQTLVSFAGALLFTEAFLYSHGAGFMLLVSLVGYVGWLVARGRVRQTAALLKIGLAFVLATVLYLPWLRQAASISVGHAVAPGLREVVETLSILLDGFHGRVVWVDWVAAGFVVLAILAGLRREGEMRAIVLSFLVAPVAICIAVSDFYRPIWLDRTLAYIEPFLLMSIAFALVRLARGLKGRAIRWGWAPLPLAAALLLVGTGLQQATYSHQWNMRDAARFLRSVTGEGDVVYVPQRRVFWGLAWYLVGPGSVNPLTTDFSLETRSHALLISKPALEGAPEGAVWWVAYRTADDPSPFAPDPSDPAWDFEDFEVVRVR